MSRFHATGAALLAKEEINVCFTCREIKTPTDEDDVKSEEAEESHCEVSGTSQADMSRRKIQSQVNSTKRFAKVLSPLATHKPKLCGGEDVRRKKKKWDAFFKERRIKVLFVSPGLILSYDTKVEPE